MTDAFLTRPVAVLGRPHAVSGAAIEDADEVAAEFAADGVAVVHRSTDPCWRSAADAAARAMDAARCTVGDPDLSIYCSETWFEMIPAEAVSRFVCALGVGGSPAMAVAGDACANFVTGVDLACRELAGGRSSVLLATVDRVPEGQSRSFRDGLALLSEAAAAAVVTNRPSGDGYRVLASARRSTSRIDEEGGDLVDVRVSVRDVQASVAEVLERAGAGRADVRWVVTNNYRSASMDFLVRAAGLPAVPRARPPRDATAHCFAADVPIVLDALLERGDVEDGDLVLALGTGARSRAALLLRAHLDRADDGP